MKLEDPKFYPSDDYIRMGKVHFRNGDYGLAEQKFRKAVEVTPKDAEAWLGLAASYDQLRRFDLADNAY
ncbi:MAG: tetratricopeptide repeat protein, partial [Alphaproteobacteria bacterium]